MARSECVPNPTAACGLETVVVLITEHYVKDTTILPAASASKALFAEMKKKGWHEVRLLGLTDKLFNPDNKPSDAFEQQALLAPRNRDTCRYGAMCHVPSGLEGEEGKHWCAILHCARA